MGTLNRYTPLRRTPMKRKRKKSRVTKDGRTILEGADYTKKLDEVYEAAKGMCQLCPLLPEPHKRPTHFISRMGATLEHPDGRGMGGGGRRDDNNVILSCWLANYLKGSKRL